VDDHDVAVAVPGGAQRAAGALDDRADVDAERRLEPRVDGVEQAAVVDGRRARERERPRGGVGAVVAVETAGDRQRAADAHRGEVAAPIHDQPLRSGGRNQL
jgi:hypothetical protein